MSKNAFSQRRNRVVSVSAVILMILATAVSVVMAAPKPGYPALMTSAGQGPDGLIIKMMLNAGDAKESGRAVPYDMMAEAEETEGVKTLIVVTGVSSKGLGSLGMELEDEIDRVKGVLDEAKKNGCYIVMVHSGGSSRRGTSSTEMIETVAPYANAIVVMDTGNGDGLFNKLGEKYGIPVNVVPNRNGVGNALKDILAGK